jgi:hypothetical protein
VISSVRAAIVLLPLLFGCATAPPPKPTSLSALTRVVESCLTSPSRGADSAAARCACRALDDKAGGQPVHCFAAPYFIGFVGPGLPVPSALPMREHYYGLAYAPRPLDLRETAQYEIQMFGYGVAGRHRSLPAPWYLITYCSGCD